MKDKAVPRVGVILSSGGIRGVCAHTGFLLWLQRQGLDIKAMAGCSAGAVVGGIFSSGRDIEDWANTLVKVKPYQFWRPSWLKFVWSVLFNKGRGYTGLSSTRYAIEFCRKQLKVQHFEQCSIPFDALAIHLASGQKTLFNKGELAERIVASAATPLLYQPVNIDGEYYSDGAVLDLAPTEAICCKHQLDIVIVHHVAQRDEGQRGLKKILDGRWAFIEILNLLLYQRRPWYLSDQALSTRKCPCGCDAIIIVVEPELPELSWPISSHGRRVMQVAMEQASDLLGQYIDNLAKVKDIAEQKLIEKDSQPD